MNNLQIIWIENESRREDLVKCLKEASEGEAWFNLHDGSVKYSEKLYNHELDITPEDVTAKAEELFYEIPSN